jgi:hypothetical protein
VVAIASRECSSYLDKWIDINMHDIVEISAKKHIRINLELYVFELHREMDKVDTCGIHRQIKLGKKQSET